MAKNNYYMAAIYLRLSREDGDVAEGVKQISNSIVNQKELVMDYLKSHPEITVVSTYTDDGYSGVDFNRPAFQNMLSDIREGKINCIIVKDLSRFGRNYIESGRYIEKIFPMLGIRFIAVNDGYDSLYADMGNDLIIPFKNLINDAYCRDISIKVRSHMEVKRRNGDYIGAFAAYGYVKDQHNKNHLVIDDYAADVVRDIFAMKLCGMSQKTIADRLNEQGILSPLQYKNSKGVPLESRFRKGHILKWSYNSVLRILTNEVYLGTVIQGKSTTPNYKIKKRVYKDPTDWIRVENMHEPIIAKSDFDLVQDLLLRDTHVSPGQRDLFPLAGLLYCADCGEPMIRKTVPSGGKRYVYYVCSGNKRDKTKCSMHSISEKKLMEAVLNLLKTWIGTVIALSEATDIICKSRDLKPEVVKCEERIRMLLDEAEKNSSRKKNLYDDFKDGILTQEEYSELREQYQRQGERIEKSISNLKAERESILANESPKLTWIEKIKSFKEEKTIDRRIICFLIDRIAVFNNSTLQVTYRFQEEVAVMKHIMEIYSESTKEAV